MPTFHADLITMDGIRALLPSAPSAAMIVRSLKIWSGGWVWMAYQLSFFCRSGEDTGASAMSSLLDELLEHGPLHGEAVGPPRPGPGQWEGPEQEAIDAFRLAISDRDQEIASNDLLLEIHVGVRFIAETVMHADPDNEHGIWGSDLLALITLSGDNPDWTLVERIWSALKSLWPAVPWDEMSGFEIAIDHLHPTHRDPN